MDSIKNAVANILASPRKLVGATIVLIILLSVPITVVLVQQQQDIRQRAQEAGCQTDADCSPGQTCIGSSNNNSLGTFCLANNAGANGAYCGTPSSQPNNLACQSSYCNSTLRCDISSTQQPPPSAANTLRTNESSFPACWGPDINQNWVTFYWGASSGATGYKLHVLEQDIDVGNNLSRMVNRFYYGIQGYQWWVSTYNSAGESGWVEGPRFNTPPLCSGPTATPTSTQQNITVNINSPTNGATVRGLIEIRASASSPSQVANIQFLVDNQHHSACIYNPPDENVVCSREWNTTTASNGSHAIKAIATDVANRRAEKQISVNVQNAGGGGQVDLENIGITPKQSTYCVGKNFTFEGKFKNNSSQDLNSVVVSWARGGVGEVGRDTFPNVGAGQTATSELITDVADTPGSYTLTFTVDPNNATPETNEDNNKKTISFTVQSTCPTTTVTKAPTQPPPPPPTVRLTATPTTAPTNVPTSTPRPSATPTISPNEARIAIELLLPGIGSDTALGQNPNPVRPDLGVEIQVFNSQNQKVKEAQGNVTYDTQTFSFKGAVSLGSTLESGAYLIKARLNNTLWKNLGLVNIVTGQTSQASQTKLISGDLDQNNELNLFDYNTMLACYGAGLCDQKTQSDLNIDGKVDEQDLNILYAGFAKRVGD